MFVNESTSTMAQQQEWLPTVRTGSFFATASGGFGCRAADVTTVDELEREFTTALTAETTTVIVVHTEAQKANL